MDQGEKGGRPPTAKNLPMGRIMSEKTNLGGNEGKVHGIDQAEFIPNRKRQHCASDRKHDPGNDDLDGVIARLFVKQSCQFNRPSQFVVYTGLHETLAGSSYWEFD